MPAKVTSKASTAKAPTAKASTAAKPTKAAVVRLSEEDKAADPENFIYNPESKKHVKRDSAMGKKLMQAEKNGKQVVTETGRLILFIQTLQDQLGLEDSVIKAALTSDEAVKAEMPRAFPAAWGGKQKTARSPEHPKHPTNSFLFFNKAVRESVVEANPGIKGSEILSIISKMWKETAEEDKAEYIAAAAADRLRYEAEMEKYEKEHPEEARKSSPGNDRPKKTTAYTLFQPDCRKTLESEYPDLNGKEITKKIAEMWNELKKEDPKKVAEYQAAADKANEDFEERLKEYMSTPGSSPKLSKAEQAKADDPEHYQLNTETGRHFLREGWRKNPDGTFTKIGKKESSPKTEKTKPAPKKAIAIKPAEKKVTKPKVEEEEVEVEIETQDDELLEE